MTGRQLDADTRNERDLQLDMELEGTFPASDPLKVTRIPLRHIVPIQKQGIAPPAHGRPREESQGKRAMSRKIAAERVRLKRAYEPPASEDGTRILIDRLWPRGVKKANAAIDEWMKEIAPSTKLRKWFGHDPERWPEFRHRYRLEIQEHPAEFRRLRELARKRPVTLVYSAHDVAHNDAVVLKDLLLNGE